jgi:NAD(P)-dependent dehydrogenase (short-subunit alcohol dehydrogenase family)
MKGFKEAKKKKGIIVGVSDNNIGLALLHHLNDKGHDMTSYRFPQDDDDLLILCNGSTHLEWIGYQNDKEIDKTINDNLVTSMNIMESFICETRYSKKVKRIIIMGSMAYNNVLNGSAAYCAAKAGINQYAKCAAYELAKEGYLVTVINPGNVLDTPMTASVKKQLEYLHRMDKLQAEVYWSKVNNLGEFITKKDIAKIVEFLLKPEARFLSGSSLDLRGSNR